jgi:hypothetical protein
VYALRFLALSSHINESFDFTNLLQNMPFEDSLLSLTSSASETEEEANAPRACHF